MQKKVSVIITVYNDEKYLDNCLKSVIGQTLKEIEIIVVNDGSEDRSEEIIRSYSQKDPRIILINQENEGVSVARNAGLKQASGKYIAFIDSDDSIDFTMMEKMFTKAEKLGCQMCVCNYVRVFDKYTEKPFFHLPETEMVYPLENQASFLKDFWSDNRKKCEIGQAVSNKLFLTEFIRKTGVLFRNRSEIFAEDALFVYTLLPLIDSFCVVNEPLYFYYQHKESVMHQYKQQLLPRCKNLISETQDNLKKLGLYEELKDALKIKCFTFLVEILYNESIGPNWYKRSINICRDEWLRGMVIPIRTDTLSKARRLIYFLYKHKLYLLMIPLFQFRDY